MQDSFFLRVQHLHDFVGIAASIKVIANIELFEVAVAAELLVVGIGDGFKAGFVFGMEHSLRITAKVGTRHRNDMNFIARHELAHLVAEAVIGVTGYMMKLIDGNEAIIKNCDPKPINSEAEGGMSTDKHLVIIC